MRPFYLRFRECATELQLLYANSLYACLFFESLSLANSEVNLYVQTKEMQT